MRLKKTQSFKLIILILIIIEIIIIFFIGIKIINKKKAIFIPLNKENIKKPIKSNYKYYYEPIISGYSEQTTWDPNNIIKYSINQDAIRAQKEFSLKKDKNTIRIITIGDSFTFGQLVTDKENYPAQLEKKLNDASKKSKYEVLNLGVPGYDTAYAVERFRIRGSKYNPDIIIWFLIEDDFTNICELEIGYAKYFKENLTEIEREKYKKIFGEKYLEEALGSEEVFKTLKLSGILKKSLTEVEKLSKLLGKKLLIITFEHLNNTYKSRLKDICRVNKCQVFDKLPNIYKSKELYLPDKHPTGQGYKKIINALYKVVINTQAI